MVKQKKASFTRLLSMLLAFLMFTYNLPLGVIVATAEGLSKADVFTLQIVGNEGAIAGATVSGNNTDSVVKVEAKTDQDGRVSFPEITAADLQGNNDFQFVVTLPGEAGEKSFSHKIANGSKEELIFNITTGEKSVKESSPPVDTEPPTEPENPGESVPEPEPEPTPPTKYEVTVNKNGSGEGSIQLNNKKYNEPIKIEEGKDVKVNITSTSDSVIGQVKVNGVEKSISDQKKYEETIKVSANTTIEVEFVKVYSISFASDGNGTIKDKDGQSIDAAEGTVDVEHGSSPSFTVTPNTGYHVEEIKIDGKRENLNALADGENRYKYTFKNVERDHQVEITFAINVYDVTTEVKGGNGKMTSKHSEVEYNGNTSVKIFPDESYKVKTLLDNGDVVNLEDNPNVTLDDDGHYTYEIKEITENREITVEFEKIPTVKGTWKDYVSINPTSGKLIDSDDETGVYIYSKDAKVEMTPVDPYKRIKDRRWKKEIKFEENVSVNEVNLRNGFLVNNVSFDKDLHILFDTEAPEIKQMDVTGDNKKESNDKVWFSGNVTVSGKIDNVEQTFNKVNYSTEIANVFYSKGEYSPEKAEEATYDPEDHSFEFKPADEDYSGIYSVWAVDKAGNVSEVKPVNVNVDQTNPTLVDGEAVTFKQTNDSALAEYLNFLTFGTYFNKEIEVTVKVQDEASGIQSISLATSESTDNPSIEQNSFEAKGKGAEAVFTIHAESFSGSLSVTVTDHTNNKETYKVTNGNSNISADNNGVFMVDKVAPTGEIELTTNTETPKVLEGEKFNQDVLFNMSVADADSGLNSVWIYVNDEIYQKYHYNKEKKQEDTYTISTDSKDIKSRDGKYHVRVYVVDNAGNTHTAEKTIYIDKTSPTIKGYTFSAETSIGEYEVIAEETHFKETVEKTDYGFYFKKPVRVTITAEDKEVLFEHASGVQSMVIYLQDHHTKKYYAVMENGSLKEVAEADIGKITPVQTEASLTFDVPKSFKGQIFAKAIDNVKNTGKFETPQGTIVESPEQHEKEEHIAMDKVATDKKDINDVELYSEDVDVTFTVTDTYSGIENIEWSVVAPYDTENNQGGKLTINNDKSYTDGSDAEGWEQTKTDNNLVTEMQKKIKVNNNSNDIVVKVKMTDRAGNVSEEEMTFSIDKTVPTIDIKYDNNTSDPENTDVYNANRTATITITERNFNPEDVVHQITNADSDVVPAIESWETIESKNPDSTTHTAVVNYTEDGDYTFDISYADNAKNKAAAVPQHAFTIDKTPPEVSVEYDNNDAANGNYYKEKRTATITVNEHNFDENRFYVTGATIKGEEKQPLPDLSDWEEVAEDVHVAKMVFEEDAFYEYDIDVADTAGNKPVEDFAAEEFFVDQTPATLVDGEAVTFKQKNDNYFAKVLNFLTFGTFFNKEITIDVKTIDGTTGIEAIELLANEKAIEQKEININPEELTGEATFTLDADYFNEAFDVKITDVAHNVETYPVTAENSNIASETNRNVIIEKEKPEVSIDVIPKKGVSSYKNQYNGEVTFEIAVEDQDSGINTVTIDVNGKKYEYDYSEREKITKSPEPYRISTDDKGIEIKDDGSYNVSVYVIDNAGNENTAETKTYKDETDPVILDYTFSTKGSKGFTTDALSKSVKLTDYGFYFKEATQVKISAEDPEVDKEFTSNLKAITVYLKDHDNGKYYAIWKNGSFKEIKESQIGSIAPITTKRDVTFNVPQSFKGQIFAQATDYVQNTGAYVTPDGAILENARKHKEEKHIAIEKPTAPAKDHNNEDLYSGNVNVDLTVTDTYSGISEIEWSVIAPYDTGNNQSGSLVLNNDKTYKKGSDSQGWKQMKSDKNLVTEMKKTITVNNDSNDIKVKVKMTDRAGNTSEDDLTFSIDKSAPSIEVSYDNNMPDADNADFYNENRTATIVITERNFKPEDVEYRVTNTDGSIPGLSGWSTSRNASNPDLTTHTATITYSADGDYTFDIQYQDNAGNKAAPVEQDSFTIDKTKPEINVSYDTNDAVNGNYFNTARTATISVKEHNFDPSRIRIQGTATDGGKAIAFPSASGWSRSGDVHTATISYSADALYSFDIDFMDMAGNVADDFDMQEFYVDQTEPELTITGVKDRSANNGKVVPVVTYSDTNFDKNAVSITLKGANRNNVKIDGSYSNKGNGQVFTFKNFEKTKENDDLYTLTATLTDFAGNETKEEIHFSVNRFGSVYAFDDSLDGMIGKYVQKERDIVLTETNVDNLKKDSITIKMTQNGNPQDLEAGKDYTITNTGGPGEWSQYTYTINKELFAGDGRYTVSIYSEDVAGNINENIDEAKKAEIAFGIDKTNPVVVPIDLEDGKQYPVDNKKATISVKDNLVLDDVAITLNDKEIEYEVDGENVVFEIPSANAPQDVKVLATDAAGNEVVTEVSGFLVTTNLVARWYNNTPLFVGSLGGVGVLIAAVLGYFLFRNRNNGNAEQSETEEKVG
ncbi:hypothetical protein [Oceanobacillus sp. Castelsardo]|uniref:hypothetical protein n=1 Tax=Oceanobacillus sp. Castelsardo TaxID=1851204 RepID=UPI000838FA0A|nr:hypothetical protein [Oceanobacillus sp. Castelsardo]